MSEILRIRKSTLDAIGNAIREKSGKANLINPLNMPKEILALSGSNNGSDVNNTSLFDGSVFSVIAGSWVDRSGSLAGSIGGGALTRSFNAYINDRTSQMVDVTNYNKLTVVFNSMSTGSSRTPFFGLWDTAPGNTVNDPTNFIAYTAITKTADKTSYSIDISDITGSYYVGISLGMGGSYDSSYSIASIMLEAADTNGGSVHPADITVYTGSDYPSSPKENDLFINLPSKTAYMYVNGSWINVDYKVLEEAYLNGDALGAGINAVVVQGNYNGNTSYNRCSLTTSGIHFEEPVPNTSSACASPYLSPAIDLTNLTAITFHVSNVVSATDNAYTYLGVNSTVPSKTYNESTRPGFTKQINVKPVSNTSYTVNVSSLTGFHYIVMANVSGGGRGAEFYIDKIIGE
jgi:hypothetical protein